MSLRTSPGLISIAALAFLVASPLCAQTIVDETDYSVRADPKWAKSINRVLEEIAKPAEYLVPRDVEIDSYFRELCGIESRTYQEIQAKGDRRLVTASPCLRSRVNARVVVTENARLEAIAARLGLSLDSARGLRVIAGEASGRSGEITDKTMRAGDVVIAERAPEWTNITVKSAMVASREAFMARLAAVLPCGADAPDECLSKRGILVTRRSVPKEVDLPPAVEFRAEPDRGAPPPEPASLEPAGQVTASLRRDAANGLLWQIGYAREGRQFALRAQSDGVASANAGTSLVPALPPIDAKQWPYDAQLVQDLIADVGRQLGPLAGVRVGVADLGLSDWKGAPLLPTMLDTYEEDDIVAHPPSEPGKPNIYDDDRNGWIDDWIGAGTERDNVLRTPEEGRSGDVGLCRTSVDYSAWSPDKLRLASHGPIVASQAGGFPLRGRDPQLDAVLPKVLFYRLVGELCRPEQKVAIGDQELATAFEYLLERSNIVVISYLGDSTKPDIFVDRVKALIDYEQNILFLPAGNPPARNLDDNPPCPPCLATQAKSEVIDRVVVVGAATRDRRRAGYSGYGANAVRLYAPGEPFGARDVRGQAADETDAATSFAAPYAAMAMAVLRALGNKHELGATYRVRSRLMLSTWSLADPLSEKAGIIDLIKVAGALHNVVEVKEPDGQGGWVLRDHVGVVTDGLWNICSKDLPESVYQAVRLGEPSPTGDRKIVRYTRKVVKDTSQAVSDDENCKPSGELTMREFGKAEATKFDLDRVTTIMLSWHKKGLVPPAVQVAARPLNVAP